MTDLSLSRVLADIQTTANPAPGVLLGARTVVQQSAALQGIFLTAKQEGWGSEKLADVLGAALETALDVSGQEAQEAARYLADEYFSTPPEGILLVSRETGRSVARITEEDLWEPPPAPREDGTLVAQPTRLRPDLEGFLVHWYYERTREQEAFAALAEWQAKTSTAMVITRKGRESLAERIRESLPSILSDLRGTSMDFLVALGHGTDPTIPEGFESLGRMSATASLEIPLADLRAFNYRFDAFRAYRAAIGSAWVGLMAEKLIEASPRPEGRPQDPWGHRFWLAAGDWTHTCVGQRVPVIPVSGDVSVGCDPGNVILTVHPESYALEALEVHDRWELRATLEYTLWVRWEGVKSYETTQHHAARVLS